MAVVPRWVAGLPLPVRAAVMGGSVLGVLGAIAGLVVGLIVNPPTAWFAVLEVGIPATILGYVVGFVGGSVGWLLLRTQRPT